MNAIRRNLSRTGWSHRMLNLALLLVLILGLISPPGATPLSPTVAQAALSHCDSPFPLPTAVLRALRRTRPYSAVLRALRVSVSPW